MTTLPVLSSAEIKQARDALQRLPNLHLTDLPAGLQNAVRELLQEAAQGHAMQVLPLGAELTSQQAADILGVSRPTLTRLLDEGRIPSWKVGTHRRTRLSDVQVFAATQEGRSARAMQELADLDQELVLL